VVLAPVRYYGYGAAARRDPDVCREDEEDLLFVGIGANLI
jgi:hypothetical protein